MRDKIAFLLSVKLFRLLAINLAIGIAAALLMTGGLLLLNPYGLRSLLLSDPSGGIGRGADAVRLHRHLRLDRDGHRDHGDRPRHPAARRQARCDPDRRAGAGEIAAREPAFSGEAIPCSRQKSVHPKSRRAKATLFFEARGTPSFPFRSRCPFARARGTPGSQPVRGLVWDDELVHTSIVTTESRTSGVPRAALYRSAPTPPVERSTAVSGRSASAWRGLNLCPARGHVRRAQGCRTPPHVLRRLIRRPLLWDEVIGL